MWLFFLSFQVFIYFWYVCGICIHVCRVVCNACESEMLTLGVFYCFPLLSQTRLLTNPEPTNWLGQLANELYKLVSATTWG